MKNYKNVSGYKRKNRHLRDHYKRFLADSSRSEYRHALNKSYCDRFTIDMRGRKMIPKYVRIGMQIRANDLIINSR